MTLKHEAPRYRVKPGCVVAWRGTCAVGEGKELAIDGWPLPQQAAKIEPINESARRIFEWWHRHHNHPALPVSLYNDLVGGFYLPGELPYVGPAAVFNPHFDQRSDSPISPVRESEIVEAMPRYKSDGDKYLGKTLVPAGKVFAFSGWPLNSFIAVNKQAKAVKAYYAENKANPALLPSPWCCFVQDVVLPALPAVKDPKAEREKERAETRKGLEAIGLDVREVG